MSLTVLLTVSSILLTNLASTQSSQVSNHPDDGIVVNNLTAVCQDGADYCEDPEDYPVDLIEKVLEKKRMKRGIKKRLTRQVTLSI